jgi:DMSO/TMAO reductase YedYZ molybdopterin-dependent catalytic subunit
MASAGITRRDLLAALGALAAAGAAGAAFRRLLLARLLERYGADPEVQADERALGLIVRGRDPDQLETPRALLDRLEMPLGDLFVRTHDHPPRIDLGAYRLRVEGLVARPLALSQEDLLARPGGSARAVLQCSGNGRAFFRPRVPGVPWEHGACGQARWEGARLREILLEAGPAPEARFLHVRGLDRMALPATPPYVRSIPLARALEEDVLVASAVNGAPLPWIHGGPARLVVPGWTGNHWVKWLSRITLAAEEEPSFYAKAAYRAPIDPCPPGGAPGETAPVTENAVKAIIALPLPGSRPRLRDGTVLVRGVAFSGRTHVVRVEVGARAEGGVEGASVVWREADLLGDETPGAWRVFSARVPASPGPLALYARASDARGAVQPAEAGWNPAGYLWNAVDLVRLEVRA